MGYRTEKRVSETFRLCLHLRLAALFNKKSPLKGYSGLIDERLQIFQLPLIKLLGPLAGI